MIASPPAEALRDALLHFDRTGALQPLDATAGWEDEGEVPETFPSGI